MYPFTESSACVCTKDGVQSVATLAGECKDATVWALIGVAGLCAGAMFAAMELAVDTVLLSADQLFLRVIKRKSSRCSRTGSSRLVYEGPICGNLGAAAINQPVLHPRLVCCHPAPVQVQQQGQRTQERRGAQHEHEQAGDGVTFDAPRRQLPLPCGQRHCHHLSTALQRRT